MADRFISIWFRHLITDWMVRKQPELKGVPFVLASREQGRIIVRAVSVAAYEKGIAVNQVVADCRAIFPTLLVFEDNPEQIIKLLINLAEWCLQYTPVVAIDPPDGLLMNVSGCAHLWGGELPYLDDLTNRLNGFGYHVRTAMADTPGCAWAVAHFGTNDLIIKSGGQATAIKNLPPAALRLEDQVLAQLDKLGLYNISTFMNMPRYALQRRFGVDILKKLDQAIGLEATVLHPVHPIIPYQERLLSMEPIRTAKGIEIALDKLLTMLCQRFANEGKGLRTGILKAYRTDGLVQKISIGTNQPSRNVAHLFRLFELKIETLAPGLGFELFILEAPLVEDIIISQETLWNHIDHNKEDVAALLDRLAVKIGINSIHRYLPQEHYWPELSTKPVQTLDEKPTTNWRTDCMRPVHLLKAPEPITVTVPIPDYPPMLFHYKGQLHKISKADGPERIERAWWLEAGLYRDYYCVEDDAGCRYWIFRLGHYATGEPQWFLHGFFA